MRGFLKYSAILCLLTGDILAAQGESIPTLYAHLLQHLKIASQDIAEVKQHFTQSVDDTYELRLKDGRHFALKHFHRTPYARQRTYEMSLRAAALGMGPAVHYIGPQHKTMLLTWVKGLPQKSLTTQQVKQIAKAFKKFHTTYKDISSAAGGTYPIEARCHNRFNDIEQSAPWNYDQLHPVIVLWKKLKTVSFPQFSEDKSLIHGDLNPSNILFLKTGKPVYIDWGDAVKSDVMDDLAALSYYFHLDRASEKLLLNAYYGEAEDMALQQSYLQYKKLFYLLHHSLWAYMKAQLFPQHLRPLNIKEGQHLTPWLKRAGRDPHQVKKAADFMYMAERGLCEFLDKGKTWLRAHKAQNGDKKKSLGMLGSLG